MKKIIGFILVVFGLGIIAYFCFFDKNDLSNDKAEKDTKNGVNVLNNPIEGSKELKEFETTTHPPLEGG